MAAGGIIAVHSVFSIQANAGKLVREQHVTQRLIEDLEQEQITLSAIFYSLTGDPDTADPEIINMEGPGGNEQRGYVGAGKNAR